MYRLLSQVKIIVAWIAHAKYIVKPNLRGLGIVQQKKEI